MVSAIKAEEIFRTVISQSIQGKSVDEAIIGPTIAQFELVCSALIKSRRLQRAHNLIEWMDNLYQSQQYHIKPTAPCYQALITAFSKRNEPEKGELLFHKFMESFKNDEGLFDEALTSSANHVIHAYSRKRKAQKAYNLLYYIGQTDGIYPDTFSFNAVLSGYMREKNIEKCIQVLQLMEDMAESGQLNITSVSYNTVMQCAVDCNLTEKVEEIFERMQEMSRKITKVKPDSRTYNILMNAYSQLSGKEGARKCEDLLRQMEENFQAGEANVKPVGNSCLFLIIRSTCIESY